MIINDNYVHGGDVYKNDVLLDFSANVNPLGTPEAVRRAAAAACGRIAAYPDPYCGALREKLARREGVSRGEIICGNGAAELIFQLVLSLRPKTALLPVPSFSEYEAALSAAGCRPEFFYLSREEGFAVGERILEAITPETELVMLCNPNNPTGAGISWALLCRILNRCRETGSWLLLDECFLDLADPAFARSLVGELREGDRVLLLRAFTKMYGMAGARLGYAICRNRELLERMCRLVQPWNVSTVAQVAGEAALDCGEFAEKTRRLIAEEKRFMLGELRRLGVAVLPGAANYLMLSGVPELHDRLLARRILIRSCGNYRGLGPGDCRIAIRTREENRALLRAMEEICATEPAK